jgi:hypothetical protein
MNVLLPLVDRETHTDQSNSAALLLLCPKYKKSTACSFRWFIVAESTVR